MKHVLMAMATTLLLSACGDTGPIIWHNTCQPLQCPDGDRALMFFDTCAEESNNEDDMVKAATARCFAMNSDCAICQCGTETDPAKSCTK